MSNLKIDLKGYIIEAEKKITITSVDGKRVTDLVKFIFLINGRINDYGEKIGKDQKFQITAINKYIEKLPEELRNTTKNLGIEPFRCSITVFLNSSFGTDKNGKDFYFNQLNLYDLEIPELNKSIIDNN